MAQPVFMAKMEIAELDPQPNRHLQIIVSLTPYGPAIGQARGGGIASETKIALQLMTTTSTVESVIEKQQKRNTNDIIKFPRLKS